MVGLGIMVVVTIYSISTNVVHGINPGLPELAPSTPPAIP
jgi:hypothetical protein